MILFIVLIYALLPAGLAVLYLLDYIYFFTDLIQPYNLSILAGAAAYIVFMSQFLLSARLKVLERRIPQNRLIALHGSAGTAAFALVLIHFIIKFYYFVIPSGISIQTALGSFALLSLAALSPLAYLVLRGKSRKKNQSPPYAKVKTAHNLFALAGLAVVVHVMLASGTWSAAQRLFVLLWGALALGAYLRHKIIRPRGRTMLKLTEVSGLSEDVHSYRFEGSIERTSGQFGYFSFDADVPGGEEHPFTVASSGGEPVKIVVRSSGDFTSSLPGVSMNASVRFDGPYGQFSPKRFSEGKPVVFLAAGIGITPILSLAGDQRIRSSYPLTILWSIKTDADLPLGDDLEALAESGELKLFIRRSSIDGRIDGTFIDSVVSELPDGGKGSAFFICGPGGFGKTMRGLLKERGVKNRQIIEERFSW